MACLVISSSGQYIDEALNISKFSPTEGVLMGEGTLSFPHKTLKLAASEASRIAMVTMQARKVDNVIMVGDVDFDILELLMRFSLPIYIHYVKDGKRVGYMFEGEDF